MSTTSSYLEKHLELILYDGSLFICLHNEMKSNLKLNLEYRKPKG